MNKKLFSLLATTAFIAACNQPAQKQAAAQPEDILKTDIDSTVNPGDDFFDYANGGWIKKNPIPGDETSWGIGELVHKELYDRLLHINEDAVKQKDSKGVTQQIADFWISGMDTVAIDKNGIEPLREELNKIAAVQTPKDVMAQAAHMHTYGAGVFFSEGAAQDLKSSDVEAYYMSQGGLGMPNRDYYFNTDERTTKIRNAYPVYIAKTNKKKSPKRFTKMVTKLLFKDSKLL